MGYVGNQQAEGFVQRPTKQDLTGATGTSLTLSHAVSKEEDIDLYINNVKQEPTTAYTVADTAVTLTGSVVASDDIYVVYNSLALQTVTPPDGSISTAKLASGAVTDAKIDTMVATKLTGTIDDARMPAGSVIQVVQGTSNSNKVVNGTTFTNTNLSATITPSSTSSKILIEVSTGLDASSAGNTIIGTIARGSTNLGHSTAGMTHGFSYNLRSIFPASVVYLDSPATTSATTYNFQVRAGGSYDVECPGTSITQVMILKEIAG